MRSPLTAIRIPSAAALVLACGGWSAVAHAGPYYLGVSQAVTYESNFVGLGRDQGMPWGFSRSDTRSTTALLAGFDQPISRQRVYANGELSANRMSRNPGFNHEGYRFDGGVDLATIWKLSGSLKASASRNLASINGAEIGMLTERNLASTRLVDATLRWGASEPLSMEAKIGHRDLTFSAGAYDANEFRQLGRSLGMVYRPGSASAFGAAARFTRGTYPRFSRRADGGYMADEFDRRDLDLTASLSPTAASTYSARASFGRTRYDVARQRDFSGLTGELSWDWRPYTRFRTLLALSREPGQDSYFNGRVSQFDSVETSRLTTSGRLTVDYDFSAKVTVVGTGGYAQRSLVRNAPPGQANDMALREVDHPAYLSLGVRWQPTRSLRFGCDGRRDKRDMAGVLAPAYSNNSVGCHGSAMLG